MTGVCERCTANGNIDKCLSNQDQCVIKDSWFFKEISSYIESQLALQDMLLSAIEDTLAGKEPSDFELSFGIVRHVYDLVQQNCDRG